MSGAKNAQLICIKDKSCFEESVNSLNEENKEKVIKDVKVVENEEKENSQVGRKQQSKTPFGQLSKKFTISIVQYKLDFHKYIKANHMYRKTPLIQPWILTSR